MKKFYAITIVTILLFIGLYPAKSDAQLDPELTDEIIYDIMIDRFNNGRQAASDQVDIDDPYTYNGGDIKGVTMMLDTLEEYGFTTINLSPIMENAEKGYHGYWVEDFYAVEEEFGTLEDLRE